VLGRKLTRDVRSGDHLTWAALTEAEAS
jgi:hypothetical protein